MTDRRVLIILNPGQQSRHYMLGLAAAAQRLGFEHACIEMSQLWAARDQHGPAHVQSQLARLVHRLGITHAVSYAWNGVLDFGLLAAPGAGGPARGQAPLAALGVRHVLLWTDHPNWFCEGAALRKDLSPHLDHPRHTHIIKSLSAAAEVRTVLGWRNVHAMPMAEMRDVFGRGAAEPPVHDVVAISGYAYAIPDEIHRFLDEDDPDPSDIEAAVIPASLAGWQAFVNAHSADAAVMPELDALGRAWVDLKHHRPRESYWRLSDDLTGRFPAAMRWLRDDASRWYGATAALRRMVDWRRSFYLAWLARRVDVGIYGTSAREIGVEQPPGAERWVDYARQPAVYRRGRVAININGSPDEEGCSHKPFQIAAAGVACLHHATRGIDDLFAPGREVLTFSRPAEMLEQVRLLCADDRRRRQMGEAIWMRGLRDHTWESRLTTMLNLADAGATAPAADAALAAA